jgi:hypothetical protein
MTLLATTTISHFPSGSVFAAAQNQSPASGAARVGVSSCNEFIASTCQIEPWTDEPFCQHIAGAALDAGPCRFQLKSASPRRNIDAVEAIVVE